MEVEAEKFSANFRFFATHLDAKLAAEDRKKGSEQAARVPEASFKYITVLMNESRSNEVSRYFSQPARKWLVVSRQLASLLRCDEIN